MEVTLSHLRKTYYLFLLIFLLTLSKFCTKKIEKKISENCGKILKVIQVKKYFRELWKNITSQKYYKSIISHYNMKNLNTIATKRKEEES